MNGKQQTVLNLLLADFAAKRGFSDVRYKTIRPSEVQTVGSWVIKPDSVVISFDLPNFPPIELTASGSRPGALPTVSTYNEFNREPNSYKPFPNGRTTYDALLFADSHAVKAGRRAGPARSAAPRARQSSLGSPEGVVNSDPYNFVLQFAASDIPALVARRLTNVDQEGAFEAGKRMAGGDYQRQNLGAIVNWKSARVTWRLAYNTDADIAAALGSAISASSEKSAIEILAGLHGVGVPVASAILTAILPEKYTIIDVYALKALGVTDKLKNRADYYIAYLEKCREIANQLNVSLRTLDHALWQFGWEKTMGLSLTCSP
jgi:hypothetical protein